MRLKFSNSLCLITLLLAAAVNADNGQVNLTGNLIQGGLVFGKVSPGTKIKINEHDVRVSSEGEFILGFGRDYPSDSTLITKSVDGTEYVHRLKIIVREYQVQKIDGLPDKKVNPDQDVLKRIQKESKEISEARSINDDRMDFNTNFLWPVKGPISGVYGSQRILNGQPRQPHFGIDVAAPVGTSVIAPAAGVVTYVNDDMYFSGGTIVLDHGHNLSSSFLHLHKILVDVGDRIEQGQQIALVGETGRVTGSHLDWRMNWFQQRLDPGLLMGEKSDLK